MSEREAEAGQPQADRDIWEPEPIADWPSLLAEEDRLAEAEAELEAEL
jgi:hypothetical protein